MSKVSSMEKGGATLAGDDTPAIEKVPVINDISSNVEPSLGYGKVDDIIVDTVNAETEYTPEQFRKLRWKIDLWLLPLMWICYGTQQADKTGVSVQAVFGLRTDTHLVGQQFSWLTTIFYIAYLVSEGPCNYIMQRVNIGKFLSANMFIWGIIVLCIAFAQNFAGLMVLRAFQGVAECTISPTFLILTGAWYTSREHTMRSIVWGTANSGMQIIAGLVEYGIGFQAQKHPDGLAPWRGISLFLGSLTILCSILVFFILGTPREVRWLSGEEKRMALARVVANNTGTDAQKRSQWKWSQVLAALKDPQTYFFFFVVIANSLPNGGVTTFGNLVYVSFGFTSMETLTEGTVPQQALSIVWFLIAGYSTLKRPNLRFFFMMASLLPAFAGMLALALLPTSKSLLWTKWGLYLMTVTGNLPGLLIWTMLPSNVAGRTKKSVTATVLFIAYCTGNAIGAQLFQAKDAPTYLPGLTACGVLFGVEFVLMGVWRGYYIWQNKKRAAKVAELGLSVEEADRQGHLNAEMDMTDTENIFFKYSY